MNYYFITGTSKGLGKSLLELLLKDPNNVVYGYARTCSLTHERYYHITIDLSDLSAVQQLVFPTLKNPERIVLINNAGSLGDINHIGQLNPQKTISCYHLNLITPVLLTNLFIKTYSNTTADRMVLNISSGAGRTPIDGWSVYCSTKAGMDMFSQVMHEEAAIDNTGIKVLSLAPGIIDTEMQSNIRTTNVAQFSNVDRFINYKKEGELTPPTITAQQVLRFITEKELQNEVVCSVRDL